MNEQATSNRVWRVYCTRPSDMTEVSFEFRGSARDAAHAVALREKAGFIWCRYELGPDHAIREGGA